MKPAEYLVLSVYSEVTCGFVFGLPVKEVIPGLPLAQPCCQDQQRKAGWDLGGTRCCCKRSGGCEQLPAAVCLAEQLGPVSGGSPSYLSYQSSPMPRLYEMLNL